MYNYNYILQQGKGREKTEPLCGRGKGGKSNSQRWCNDVIAIMRHHVRTQKDKTTNLLISSNVHYVHLGRNNNHHDNKRSELSHTG